MSVDIGALLPTFYSGNGSPAYFVYASKFPLRKRTSANIANLIIRKLSIPMVQSVVMAALVACALVIVVLRSYAKMLWIHARRIVAGVHDYLSLGDLADKVLVGISMRAFLYFPWENKNAITVAVCSTEPQPAGFCLFYSSFENVIWLKDWKLLQGAISNMPLVAWATQLSSYCVSQATIYAKHLSSILISHIAPPDGCCNVALVHGAGNVRI